MKLMSPHELKSRLGSGLLFFPVTDFDGRGEFAPRPYERRLEWLNEYGPGAVFAAGGAGELFSLTADEHSRMVAAAVATARGRLPVVAGAGGPTRTAIEWAQRAESLGADGLLLLPHYLTDAPTDGLAAHVEAVCRAVQFGVILYQRGVCRLPPEAVETLAARCPNLIGFKDGIGDLEQMVAIRRRLGDRLAFMCGLPTAEIYAPAYRAIGVPVYSSAVFNFLPRTAMDFHRAVARDDKSAIGRLLDEFFLPYAALRNQRPGYAVSIVKAGVRLVGRDAGPVRPPLSELTADETDRLRALIEAQGPQAP